MVLQRWRRDGVQLAGLRVELRMGGERTVQRAAEVLGISRKNLWEKMKEYEID